MQQSDNHPYWRKIEDDFMLLKASGFCPQLERYNEPDVVGGAAVHGAEVPGAEVLCDCKKSVVCAVLQLCAQTH